MNSLNCDKIQMIMVTKCIIYLTINTLPMAVADPGFPQGGGGNSPGLVLTYNFAKISQKLHEIERIWTPGGEAWVQNFTMNGT